MSRRTKGTSMKVKTKAVRNETLGMSKDARDQYKLGKKMRKELDDNQVNKNPIIDAIENKVVDFIIKLIV